MSKNNVKKIGILSMHRIINYGSFMQALGLKLMIESLGFDVCFVDYHIGSTFSKQNIKNSLCYKFVRNVFSFFKPIKKNLERDQITSQYTLLGINEKYNYRCKVDTLVIGSDEVFNYIQNGEMVGISPELIGMNNRANRVISYAASCGNLTVDRLMKYNKVSEFADAMMEISNLSVRDYNTYHVVETTSGRKPLIHLDPVLVSDFRDIFIDSVHIENYILVYGYTNRFSDYEGECIVKYARENNLKVVALGGKQKFAETQVVCKPTEVLAYFKHAKLVITDTFHGTIFSILSHANVSVIVRDGEDGNMNKLTCLMEQMCMTNKIVKDVGKLEKIVENTIDYEKIDAIRRAERKKSLDYLRDSLYR